MRLRYVPDLRFESDLSFDEAARIEQRLEDPVVRRDLDVDADAAGDPGGNGSDGTPA